MSRQLTLLSKKLQRQLRLLEILFEGKKYRFGDLEVLLDCSSKTLRNDLADINSYANGIRILSDRESGVTALISPHITEDYIYRIVMEESLEFRYLEAVLLKNYDNYFALAEDLYVSESTLRRIADKVKPLLKKYQLNIQGLTKLTGDNQTITELTIQFLSEKYHYFENAFPTTFCQWVQQFVADFLVENDLTKKAATLDSEDWQTLYFLVASRVLQAENGPIEERKQEQQFQFEKISGKNTALPLTGKKLTTTVLNHIFEPAMIQMALDIIDIEMLPEKDQKIISGFSSFIDQLEHKYQILNEDKEKVIQKINKRLNQQAIPAYLL